MKKIDLKIGGMGCMSCVNKIKNALTELNGVESAEVDLKSSQASINYDDGKIDTAQFIKAVENAGYTVQN